MEQPRRNDDPNRLRLSDKEIDQNRKVIALSKTKPFADKMVKTQGVIMNPETGKADAKIQQRRIQQAKPGSGKNTRVIGEDGSILYEAPAGSKKEKEMLRKVRNQEADTNARRNNKKDIVNFQTGDRAGNAVYDRKMDAQRRLDTRRR